MVSIERRLTDMEGLLSTQQQAIDQHLTAPEPQPLGGVTPQQLESVVARVTLMENRLKMVESKVSW